MTRRTRTILFFICFFLLITSAPAIVLYSQGYRLDFETKKIVQTGGFYFKVLPKNVEIYLTPSPFRGGGLKKRTDFLFGSVLIKNLLPKTYEIKIEKDEYQGWKKSLEVKEKQVTELKNVVLIPKDPNFVLWDKNIEDFWASTDNKKIILKKGKEKGWSLEIFELGKNNLNYLSSVGSKELLDAFDPYSTSTDLQLLDLEFSPDSKKLLLKTVCFSLEPTDKKTAGESKEGDKENNLSNVGNKKITYFVLEIDNPSLPVPLDFLGENINELSFSPQNSKKIFFSAPLKKESEEGTAKGKEKAKTTEETDRETKMAEEFSTTTHSLFEADYYKKEISQPIINDLITYKISNGDIIWLSGEGFLRRSNLDGKTLEILNLLPLEIKPGVNYQLANQPPKILLKAGGSLYFFNRETKKFEEISGDVKNFRPSPDFKKAAYFNNYEIWILFLEKEEGQPQKEAGEKLFLTRFSENIQDCFWLTSHYLIFNAGNIIKVAEIDDRDGLNIVDLAEFKEPKIFFSQTDKKLYVLSEGNLYQSKKLY